MYIVVTEAAEPCKAFGCRWRESTVLTRVAIKTTSHAQWDAMYMHFAADGLGAVRRHGQKSIDSFTITDINELLHLASHSVNMTCT